MIYETGIPNIAKIVSFLAESETVLAVSILHHVSQKRTALGKLCLDPTSPIICPSLEKFW